MKSVPVITVFQTPKDNLNEHLPLYACLDLPLNLMPDASTDPSCQMPESFN